ncbi:MAG: hypothetical protein K2N69_04210 [Helicobacter sp.]|nr:hypothetical protein [Helicobacter sp.]
MTLEQIERDVSEAIEKVFANGDYGLNEGEEDNHCGEKVLDYFRRLSQGDPEALAEQKEMMERLRQEDFSELEKNIKEL